MIYSPDDLQHTTSDLTKLIGGKGLNVLKLWHEGLPIPKPLFIGVDCYEEFVDHNNLKEKIELELHRKVLEEMRWEEIWDIALRIQSLFLQGDFPTNLADEITDITSSYFGKSRLVIRSSAPGEDSAKNSFAGLHESYLNVAIGEEFFTKIKKVWASLWSDRAILYRQELGLDVTSSTMAILVQELVEGDCSGVTFSQSPMNDSQLVIEAVHGLNQGLVDGTVEPDRWTLQRQPLEVVDHYIPERCHYFTGGIQTGVRKKSLEANLINTPPLNRHQVEIVSKYSLQLEELLDAPQDIEWTFRNDKLFILQTRPLTTADKPQSTDKRPWYLSLTRSYDNLIQLWKTIDQVLLPAMDKESEELSQVALETFTDEELASELKRRESANSHWTSVYWADFIPFAHGARLLGELYNEVMQPDDPFEFVGLLTGQKMLSTDRNGLLYECAEIMRARPELIDSLKKGQLENIEAEELVKKIQLLTQYFAMSSDHDGQNQSQSISTIAAIILQYSKLDSSPKPLSSERNHILEEQFIKKASNLIQYDPATLLEMARASYRIRDDDNIHLGRINTELDRAIHIARNRLTNRTAHTRQAHSTGDLISMLLDKDFVPLPVDSETAQENKKPEKPSVHARQLQGQAASTGIARGKARVISKPSDLNNFQKGEILVIDSIDPTMTFFAPLAAGIVERRGGMLIHGAIIAREYGIPCITGIIEATKYIRTGDMITVDGYLGICTIARS